MASEITETLLLKILTEKDSYKRYGKFVKSHVLSNWGGTLFKDFGEYFDNFGVDNIDLDKFKTWFTVVKHQNIKADKREVYETAIDNINNLDMDEIEVEVDAIIREFTKRDYFSQIADKSLQIAEGEDEAAPEDIRVLLKEYEDSIGQVDITDKLEVKTGIIELIQSQAVQDGLKWRLPEFNYSIGPVKHQLVIFGARPNSGKTLVLTSELSYMAEQLKDTDKDVIFLNNEEEGNVVKHRIVQSALARTDEDLLRNPVKALEDIKTLWGSPGRVKVFDDVYDLHTANSILERNSAGVIVVDQLWNMKGIGNRVDSEVTRITLLYKEARKWGKLYKCPVLIVHQLGGNAGGVMFPNMEHFYLSQTALQGDGDVIVTLGKSYDQSIPEMRRGIHIVKNKLGKGTECRAELKHGQMEVDLEPHIGRIRGHLV